MLEEQADLIQFYKHLLLQPSRGTPTICGTHSTPRPTTRCGQGGGDRSLEREELAGAAH